MNRKSTTWPVPYTLRDRGVTNGLGSRLIMGYNRVMMGLLGGDIILSKYSPIVTSLDYDNLVMYLPTHGQQIPDPLPSYTSDSHHVVRFWSMQDVVPSGLSQPLRK